MSIRAQRIGRTIRLSLKGAMALGDGSGSLKQAVGRALKEGIGRIEIDASGVKFLDAAGLGELVACRNLARQAGAAFRLRGATGKSLELLRLTGLEARLTRHARREPFSGFRWRVA